jgi:hypothetical protein
MRWLVLVVTAVVVSGCGGAYSRGYERADTGLLRKNHDFEMCGGDEAHFQGKLTPCMLSKGYRVVTPP